VRAQARDAAVDEPAGPAFRVMSVRALGIDLAWADAGNETGVVALDPDGGIAAAGWTTSVAETLEWVRQHAEPDTLAFVDAPLLVLNDRGQRLCEREVGRRYGRWKVSANSTNRASARLAGVALLSLLRADGWRYDDGSGGPGVGGRVVSECYPYTTIVGAPELGYVDERPRYKRKPCGISTAEWRAVRAANCDDLVKRIARLRDADPPMDLRSHPVTAALIAERSPEDHRAYKHREDLIDACLAAWTAALWRRHGHRRCQVLGRDDDLVDARGTRGTIIAPARESGPDREASDIVRRIGICKPV
jgi:predicted RNase H-like nuclease